MLTMTKEMYKMMNRWTDGWTHLHGQAKQGWRERVLQVWTDRCTTVYQQDNSMDR